MQDIFQYTQSLDSNGFVVIDKVFSEQTIQSIINIIDLAADDKETFRKTKDLFAIRQFLKEVPDAIPLIFSQELQSLIETIFGKDFFVVKSIYFDKPGTSNWFVAYHQDLTISVDQKAIIEEFNNWSIKQDQYAVQPPIAVLENNFTIRVHLDDTGADNGALRVVPGSHLKGIYRPETIDWTIEKEETCNVPKGGIMIMKPLLLHASSRTTNDKKRRVVHIEFSNQKLPDPLQWSELLHLKNAAVS